MLHKKLFALILCATTASSLLAKDLASITPAIGPTNVVMNNVAALQVPDGTIFIDGEATRAMLQAGGDRVTGNEAGTVRGTNWTVFFRYNEEGHVKDDDKNKLPSLADDLLKSYREGTAEQNKEYKSRGLPLIEIVGWEQKPHYDEVTHNLTWAIRGSIGGEPLLNYNTRLLGRVGFMEVILACDPKDLPETYPAFTNLLAGYSFQPGKTYAEYKSGDKLAKYGLGALVVGGAAVGAAKLGLLAWLFPLLKKGWILIVAAFAGIANFFRRLFGRGKKDNNTPST